MNTFSVNKNYKIDSKICNFEPTNENALIKCHNINLLYFKNKYIYYKKIEN